MLGQPRLLVPFTFERRVFQTYLLQVEFSTADAAPMANPYAGEIGSFDVDDASAVASVSAGKYTHSIASVPDEIALYSTAAFSRVTGRTLTVRGINVGTGRTNAGWSTGNIGAGATTVLAAEPNNNAQVVDNGSTAFSALDTLNSNTYDLWLTLRSAGGFVFQRGGGAIELAWVTPAATQSSLKAFLRCIDGVNTTRYVDAMRIKDVGSPFDSDYGIAAVHTSASSGSDYSATANGIFDLAITAPASLAGEAGLKFRKNGGDYWKVNFNSSGDLIVQRYAANAAQGSPVTLGSGVITGSATRTLRVKTNGSDMDFYTLSGSTWTKQGGTQTDSTLAANTGVSPFADSSWTSGGGSLGQLDAYARTSTQYDILDTV